MLKLEFWYKKDHHETWYVIGDARAIWQVAWELRQNADMDMQITSVRTQMRIRKEAGVQELQAGV